MNKGLDINLKDRYVIKGRIESKPVLRMKVDTSSVNELREKLKAAINRASAAIEADLKRALDGAIRSKVWDTVDGQDDIFETGELLRSGTVTISRGKLKIAYDAPYSTLVHYGGYILPYGDEDQVKVYLPPKPWVDAVLRGTAGIQRFDFDLYYRREIEKAFR